MTPPAPENRGGPTRFQHPEVPVVTQPTPVGTIPDTVPETSQPTSTLGCDESNDPEIQALLWTNDGAIRWMEDGEMITLYPEVGMEPVGVCLDAYTDSQNSESTSTSTPSSRDSITRDHVTIRLRG